SLCSCKVTAYHYDKQPLTLKFYSLEFKRYTLGSWNVNKESLSILRKEALWIRSRIESIAHSDSLLFNPDFPINACKHASMLYCFHMELKDYCKPLELVFGISKMRSG